jgi:hypothetical protein
VPPVYEVGDLDCQWFNVQPIVGIVLADPCNDPQGRDDRNSVDDGYGSGYEEY